MVYWSSSCFRFFAFSASASAFLLAWRMDFSSGAGINWMLPAWSCNGASSSSRFSKACLAFSPVSASSLAYRMSLSVSSSPLSLLRLRGPLSSCLRFRSSGFEESSVERGSGGGVSPRKIAILRAASSSCMRCSSASSRAFASASSRRTRSTFSLL